MNSSIWFETLSLGWFIAHIKGLQVRFPINMYSKTCLKRPLKKKTKLVFKTDYHLMQVKSIAECSMRASCNTFNLH